MGRSCCSLGDAGGLECACEWRWEWGLEPLVLERQRPRVQQGPFRRQGAAQFGCSDAVMSRATVQIVADDRVADRCQMHANLVCAPRFGAQLEPTD